MQQINQNIPSNVMSLKGPQTAIPSHRVYSQFTQSTVNNPNLIKVKKLKIINSIGSLIPADKLVAKKPEASQSSKLTFENVFTSSKKIKEVPVSINNNIFGYLNNIQSPNSKAFSPTMLSHNNLAPQISININNYNISNYNCNPKSATKKIIPSPLNHCNNSNEKTPFSDKLIKRKLKNNDKDDDLNIEINNLHTSKNKNHSVNSRQYTKVQNVNIIKNVKNKNNNDIETIIDGNNDSFINELADLLGNVNKENEDEKDLSEREREDDNDNVIFLLIIGGYA